MEKSTNKVGKYKRTEKHLENLRKYAFKKGMIPWNKGLTTKTDERVKKYGEKSGNTRKGKLVGIFSPNHGRKHTEEEIIKMKNAAIKDGRKPPSRKDCENIIFNFKNLPNKPEKVLINLLNTILPNEYKYIGNCKLWIEDFNPDFINCNGQKKIIELFGDYWHRNTQERDKNRLETYAKYGYNTLVIWEHELKDLHNVRNKILEWSKL